MKEVYQEVPVGLVVKAPGRRAGDRGFEPLIGGITCLFSARFPFVFMFHIVFQSCVTLEVDDLIYTCSIFQYTLNTDNIICASTHTFRK